MSSILPFQPDLQEQLQHRAVTLEAEVRRLTAENTHLRTEAKRLKPFEEQKLWEDRLFRNPHLSPTHKLTLRESCFGKHKVRMQGEPTRVFIPALAEMIGLSAKTTGKSLQFLHNAGAIERGEERDSDTNGNRITRITLRLTEQVRRPENIVPPQARNHGGLRQRCKDCGSENLVIKTQIICQSCGGVQKKTTHVLNSSCSHDDYEKDEPGDILSVGLSTKPAPPPEAEQAQARQALVEAPPPASTNACLEPTPEGERHTTPTDKMTAGSEVPASTLEGVQPTAPTDNLSVLKPEEEMDNLSIGHTEKPPTPPEQDTDSGGATGFFPAFASSEPEAEVEAGGGASTSASSELALVAEVLHSIAGEAPDYIVMNSNPHKPGKYLTVHEPLTLADVQRHLQGKRTVGTTLSYADGWCAALCFDVDHDKDWQLLQEAAQLLYPQGYQPVCERSPVDGRGGHLWLLFDGLVHARSAYEQVCMTAPMLSSIKEYWPGGSKNKVRLLAGVYMTPTFRSRCRMHNAAAREVSNLLNYLTPASLIADALPLEEQSVEAPTQPHCKRDKQSVTNREQRGVDTVWLEKYGKAKLWFAWTPAQLAEWYQHSTHITDLLPPEHNGNGLATWRGERTASVAYTPDGNGWVDFGASARRADGKQDGGDCLELLARMQQRTKAEVMSDLGKLLVQEARAALLAAARAGLPLPAWLMALLTDAGIAVYNRIALRDGHKGLGEDECAEEYEVGGAAGFSLTPDIRTTDDEVAAEEQPTAEELDAEIPTDTTITSSETDSNSSRGGDGLREPYKPEHFSSGENPCKRCGCALYRDMAEYRVCVRCYPPRGYHLYSDLVDARYPLRRRV